MNDDGRGAHGQFVWHELVSGDIRGEKTIYAALFGWDVLPIEHELGVLDPIIESSAGARIGGFRSPRTGFEGPHWLPSVAVDDLDDVVERVETFGGIVLTPRLDVPGVGDHVVVQDRQGASLGLIRVTGRVPALALKAAAGVFCWDELVCRDPDDAAAFYGEIFGWSVHPAAGRADARVFMDGDNLIGGVTTAPKGFRLPPAWLPHVCTADLDAALRRAYTLRFRVPVERFDLPNFGSSAMIRGRTGATLGLFQPPEWLLRDWHPEVAMAG